MDDTDKIVAAILAAGICITRGATDKHTARKQAMEEYTAVLPLIREETYKAKEKTRTR